MRGRPHKTGKSESKKISGFNEIRSTAKEVSVLDHVSTLKLPALKSLPVTPKRGSGPRRRTRGATSLTSTPVHGCSTSRVLLSSPGADEEQLEYAELITQAKTPEPDSLCCKSKSQKIKSHTSQPRQKRAKQQTQKNGNATKCRRGRPRKKETNEVKGNAATQPSKRFRPRFELQRPDAAEQDESLLSSDLSIELSHYEEELPSLSLEAEESEDEEELPSYLINLNSKPPSITEGAFVWGKCRNYPYWPALVKNVNQKLKKASIMFVDQAFTGIQKQKGFTLPLKSLKPLECEEADELMQKAKESYEAAITWSLEFIEDYRIRIACGSFSGSFIEYCNHDMSYPVRRKYPQAASERLTITTDITMEEPCEDPKEDSVCETRCEVSTCSKRLLPDRTHAAHNRANEKLVHFIVKQRMVDKRLLAVMQGQQQSRWLRSFLSAKRRRVVNIYLEDDQQLDQVYWYLNELYAKAVATSPCLAEVKSMERVPFVLDVLLPEAIIYAIAGVDNVSVKKAEEKYLSGRCISNRERQEFDLMIERQMRRKSQRQNTGLELFSDALS